MGSGTTATISCKMTGVTEALTVTWLKSGDEEIKTGGGFTVSPGRTQIQINTYDVTDLNMTTFFE